MGPSTQSAESKKQEKSRLGATLSTRRREASQLNMAPRPPAENPLKSTRVRAGAAARPRAASTSLQAAATTAAPAKPPAKGAEELGKAGPERLPT